MSSSTRRHSDGSDARTCCVCKCLLERQAFTEGERRRDSPRCRSCVSTKNKAYAQANRERLVEQRRDYYQRNKERLNEASKRRHRDRRSQYAEARKRWWEANKGRINTERRQFRELETWRSWVARLRKHGLTPEDYDRMLEVQGYGCALCGTKDPGKAGGGPEPRVFAVDHCHDTGVARGLLCHNCNRGLGCFRDRPEVLAKAAAYVRVCCP